jgi:hypothetical protein
MSCFRKSVDSVYFWLVKRTPTKGKEIFLSANCSNKTINIEHLPAGIYLLRLQTDVYNGAKKFVKY